MIIAKNDEAKRSKIWRIVTLVSSVLIIVIAIFLLTKDVYKRQALSMPLAEVLERKRSYLSYP